MSSFSFLLLLASLPAFGAERSNPYLSAVEGVVQKRNPDKGDWVDVKAVPEDLAAEDMVWTHGNSAATLKFQNETRIELGQNTYFTVDKPGGKGFDGELTLGLLKAFVQKVLSGQFIIRTPTAVLAVRGTEFEVLVAKDGGTSVALYKGQLSVADKQGKQLLLKPNQKVEVDKKGVGEAKTASAPREASDATALAKKAVEALVKAYESKDRAGFLKLVSDDFRGGNELEDAVAKDFKRYSALGLELHLGNPQVKGDIVSFDAFYDLQASGKSEKTASSRGTTKLSFRIEDGQARLYRMEQPFLFGKEPEGDVEAGARQSLLALAKAYSEKRRSAFMKLVSDDFQGNSMAFEDAILKDFQNYKSISLDIIVDAVTVTGDKSAVQFHYDLSFVDGQGQTNLFKGAAEYHFKWEDGTARLYSMSAPIIFGNSLPQAENPIAQSQSPIISQPPPLPPAPVGAPGPANAGISGTWIATSGSKVWHGTCGPLTDSGAATISFFQNGNAVTATATGAKGTAPLNGTVSGSNLTFTIIGTRDCNGVPNTPNPLYTCSLAGDIANCTISGSGCDSCSGVESLAPVTGSLTLVRQSAAANSPVHGSQQFDGNGNFTVPSGVNSVTVEVWGGGGGGAAGGGSGGGGGGSNTTSGQTGGDGGAGGGGGGGSYNKQIIPVIPGRLYPLTVGAGGAGGTPGTCGAGSTGTGSSGTAGSNGQSGGNSRFDGANGQFLTAGGGFGGGGGGGGPGGAFGIGGQAAPGTEGVGGQGGGPGTGGAANPGQNGVSASVGGSNNSVSGAGGNAGGPGGGAGGARSGGTPAGAPGGGGGGSGPSGNGQGGPVTGAPPSLGGTAVNCGAGPGVPGAPGRVIISW